VTLPPYRPAQTRAAVAAFVSYAAITLIPAIGGAFIPAEDREWPYAILVGTMLFIFGPLVQLLGFAALGVQARETIARSSAGALSLRGLVVQAVVFLLVGVSFVFRVRLPSEELDEHWIVNARDWYWKVGWATINNLVFALTQAVLAYIVLRQDGTDSGERAALLS